MPPTHKPWLWPVAKALLVVALLVLIGRRFAFDLAQLNLSELTLRPAWLLLSAALYLLALGCAGLFWYRLLWDFGEKPALFPALRAYYVSHLGKYIPGKALALVIRGALIRSPDVRFGVAVLSAFYEVLTTMAAGALLAAVLFVLDPSRQGTLDVNPVVIGLVLLPLLGVPLLPAVFNRLVQRLARRFQKVESFQLPRLRTGTLLVGLGLGCVGWALMGLSLWALVEAVVPVSPTLDLSLLGRYTAMVALAYVAGFLALIMPSGVGVREYFLLRLLPPVLPQQVAASAEPVAAAVVLLLRLLWTAAELLVAGVLYWWPGMRRVRLEAPEVPANPPSGASSPAGPLL